MKKLFFAIVLLVSAVLSYAQTDTYYLTSKEWSKTISDPMGTGAGDTLAGATAVYIVLEVTKPQGQSYNYDHYIYLDSLGDGTNVTVTLQGSYDNSNWHTIGSAQTWTCDVDDTTLHFTNLSSVETVSSTIAQHTITFAADTVYKYGWNAAVDTIYNGAGIFDYGDTTYNAERVATIAAQTITTTVTDGSIAYTYQRFYLLGGGATAGTDIDKIEWSFIKPKNE